MFFHRHASLTKNIHKHAGAFKTKLERNKKKRQKYFKRTRNVHSQKANDLPQMQKLSQTRAIKRRCCPLLSQNSSSLASTLFDLFSFRSQPAFSCSAVVFSLPIDKVVFSEKSSRVWTYFLYNFSSKSKYFFLSDLFSVKFKLRRGVCDAIEIRN